MGVQTPPPREGLVAGRSPRLTGIDAAGALRLQCFHATRDSLHLGDDRAGLRSGEGIERRLSQARQFGSYRTQPLAHLAGRYGNSWLRCQGHGFVLHLRP